MLVGLMVGLFASVSSAMIVATALPTIVRELGATTSDGVWIVVASLLTMTVSTPIWGRCADHLDRKRVTQVAILLFVVGSLGAGLAPSLGMLIGMRAVQGAAMGGLLVASQAVIGAITTPRQRGAYSGYLGAVMSIASLCGPLMGGLIIDAPGLGWRWCFFLLVPLAVASLVIVQATLTVGRESSPFRVDGAGTTLIAVTITALVAWITFAGVRFDWVSWPSVVLLAATLLAGTASVLVERRVRQPVLDLALFREPTVRWTVIGSIAIGAVTFASMLYLSQYLQIGRGYSASWAGALAAPMLLATVVASIIAGHLVARTGRLRAVLIGGSVLLSTGLGLLGTIGSATPDWFVIAATVLVGLGIGSLMQNFVLAAQNAVDLGQLGRVSSTVSMFRSLSGALGVSVLGAVLAHGAGTDEAAAGYPQAFAGASATVFAVSAVFSLLSLVAALAIRPGPLRETIRR